MESPSRERGSRRVIASYDSYADAQKAADRLSDEGFAVNRLSIRAEDLHLVERGTGRLSYFGATLRGAGSGAAVGALFGFVINLLNLMDSAISALAVAYGGLVFGMVIGAITGLISHATSGKEWNFSSIGTVEAGRYDVVVDEVVADEASRLAQLLSLLDTSRPRLKERVDD